MILKWETIRAPTGATYSIRRAVHEFPSDILRVPEVLRDKHQIDWVVVCSSKPDSQRNLSTIFILQKPQTQEAVAKAEAQREYHRQRRLSNQAKPKTG